MTSRTQMMLCSMSFALIAAPAFAQDDAAESYSEEGYVREDSSAGEGKGFALGLRAGFAVPYGDLAGNPSGEGDGAPVGDLVSSVIPLELNAGYFFNKNFYLGAFFQYGLGSLNTDTEDGEEDPCSVDGVSCSATQLRFGVNAAYHFDATPMVDPWVGVGIGYEILNSKVSAEALGQEISAKTSVKGFEFISAQGGVDFRISPKFSVGPYITATVGQYSSASISLSGDGEEEEQSQDLEEKAIHGWINGGVRAQFRF
ncbi:outer membrane beta-barrel protein [Myxococcus fulvus]|uniref:outer membrane beta-barrel protein n=1 Tax=Myxococcus TaxID=32 RepID=UPI0020BDACF2|nr:outer membrane beta-barrel protein [Myxococcus fulvus]MCK8497404.1 autotransporter outer membrane beta-barrel domain-containing protein [Myxococcus fulvus]